MSKTAIVFLGVYGAASVAAFVFPPAGVWGFLFESNHHPPYHWWGGPLSQLGNRWSYYIGAVMVATVFLHWRRYPHAKVFRHPQTLLLGLFVANAFVVTVLWSYPPTVDRSWDEAIGYLKWLLVYVCIVKTHSDKRWMSLVLLIYIGSCFVFGWDTTFHAKGGRFVHGGPTTATFDENFVAAHVVAFIPITSLYLLSPGTDRRLRFACLLGLPLMLNLIAHASSRGAFLALLAAASSLLVLARGRLRRLVALGLLGGALLSLRLFHEQFWERMSTISSYQDDESSSSRLDAWAAAWTLAGRNGLGYGAESFDRGLAAPLMTQFHTTHNLFFELLVAWGWQGVVLFFGFVLITLCDCWKLYVGLWQKDCWPPSRQSLEALGVLVGLISMLVASVFLNRTRWELWWVLGAYVVCMKHVYGDAAAGRAAGRRHLRDAGPRSRPPRALARSPRSADLLT